jgi:malonyl CoA-acyl carrier protein transacylase
VVADERVAVVFPGQGSQGAGMRALVERDAPELLERAVELLGCDPFERLEEGTRFVQPAIYCTSVASWRSIAGEVRPAAVAGHSLGELAALVAAGALDALAGLELVAVRARVTQEVARRAGGGMLAVMGAPAADVEPLAEAAGVTVANDNSPKQIVLSGGEEGLEAAGRAARERRLKVRRLDVDGPFHSPAMRPAVAEFAAALAAAEVREPRFPVWSSISAAPFEDVRSGLADALVSRVRWRECVERLRASGVERFVEVEPGHVLSGLIKRTVDGVRIEAVEKMRRGAAVAA